MSDLVFGSDPEVFAGEKVMGKIYVVPPALFREEGIDHIKDEKHPIFIQNKKEGIKIIEDGAAFEFTVLPSMDWKEVFSRIQLTKDILKKKILSKFSSICDGNVYSLPTINYHTKAWAKKGEEFENALIFGCDRDYDVWDNNRESVTIDARKHAYRYGGGHIHISGSGFIKEEPLFGIECLAATLGLAAVAYSNVPDLEKKRTSLYGRPTKYRPQQYGKLFKGIPNTDFGIEYRTPSNTWTNSIEIAEQVFKWATIGINSLLEGGLGLELLPHIKEDVSDSIINCDQPKALELLSYIEGKV